MEHNCFLCGGVNQECVNERKFVPYSNNDTCVYYAIAKSDLDKLSKGENQTITLGNMLEEYLSK